MSVLPQRLPQPNQNMAYFVATWQVPRDNHLLSIYKVADRRWRGIVNEYVGVRVLRY